VRLGVETIVERCAFGLEDFSAGKDVYFRKGWEGELERISKQVCGDRVGGLKGYDMSASP